jgi:hypothetical protein
MSNEQEKKPITFKELYAMQSEALYDLIMENDQQWRKEWADDGFQQQNATTEKPYNNLNQTLLFKRAVKENMDDPRWITFNQAKEKGYKVKKGVKGSQIFRLVRGYDRLVKDENGNLIQDENGKNKMEHITYDRPRIKMFTVFNAQDVENIPPFVKAEIPEEHKRLLQQENYKNAEIMVREFCEKNGISLQEMASERAFHQYNNGSDDKKVVVPLKAQFDDLNSYFATLFHEVGHSTKHLGIRINQETDTPMGNEFGSRNYAKEELTAELTSLLLCKQFGIDSSDNALQDNSFSYLQSWILNGLLTKEDFEVATIEANRASKAIFEYAPEMKLTLDDMKQDQNEKIVIQAVEWVLSDKALTPDYMTMNAIRDNQNLSWDYIREEAKHHLQKNDFELAEKIFDTQQNYSNLRDEANSLKNGSPMTIDFAETILEKHELLTNYEKAVMQASIGFNQYDDLEIRANAYLSQWEKIKENMQSENFSEESKIIEIAKILTQAENKIELKAVVSQILENKERNGEITQEKHNELFSKYKHYTNREEAKNGIDNTVSVDNIDTFTKAINALYQKGNAGILTLNDLAKGKERNILPLTEEEIKNGIKNGYLKITHQSRSPTYAITGTGETIINNAKEKALAVEAEKSGKKVSKKEINEMYDSIYSTHRIHFSGSTNTEFRDSSFPNYIIPKIEEAQKLLERPLNEHSLPYKEMLENAIKNSELVMKKWDELQENRLTTSQGEDIINIKLLWNEHLADVQNISFNTNLDKLQKWFTDTYGDTENKFNPLNINYQGYAKNNFIIAYKEQSSNEITNFELRIDVGKSPNDFNPLTSHIKNYLESVLNREFIKQQPKLSADIKRERELAEAKKVQHTEQQGIKM